MAFSPAPQPSPPMAIPARSSPAPAPRPPTVMPLTFSPAPAPSPPMLIPMRSSPAPAPRPPILMPFMVVSAPAPRMPILRPFIRPPPGATPSERPLTIASLLSFFGRQKVTLTPLILLTWLSRKLNRRPLKVFELPKLRPQSFEGMSRLWANRPAAEAVPRTRTRARTRLSSGGERSIRSGAWAAPLLDYYTLAPGAEFDAHLLNFRRNPAGKSSLVPRGEMRSFPVFPTKTRSGPVFFARSPRGTGPC